MAISERVGMRSLSQKAFLRGWRNRVERLRREVGLG